MQCSLCISARRIQKLISTIYMKHDIDTYGNEKCYENVIFTQQLKMGPFLCALKPLGCIAVINYKLRKGGRLLFNFQGKITNFISKFLKWLKIYQAASRKTKGPKIYQVVSKVQWDRKVPSGQKYSK